VLGVLLATLGAFRAAFRPRASLVAENLALRQQLALLRRKTGDRGADRADGEGESDLESSSDRDGSREALGHRVDKNTVAKYMPKEGSRPRRASQPWATFVRNHLAGTLAIDFFTVPTVTFDILYVFVVLSLERRLILHVNVTAHPYAEWAAQQIVEAFGAEGAFKFLIRDRDKIFGAVFDRRVENLGTRQLRTAPRSRRDLPARADGPSDRARRTSSPAVRSRLRDLLQRRQAAHVDRWRHSGREGG
jgi:hypothetical protein